VSDYETTQRRRNMIVGVFVVVGMCALVWLIFKFGDLPVVVGQMKSYQVSVQFPRAPGVEENTPVRFCGYQIGRVTDVRPPKVMPDLNTSRLYHQTIVILSIDKQYDKIPANIETKLMTRGLGSSYIELQEQPYDANEPPQEFLALGSVLQGSTSMTSEFFPEESQKKLDELINGLKTFISNANDIIGDEDSKENIKKIVANLTDASQQAKQTIEEFRKFAAAGTTTFKNTDAKIDQVVTAVVDTSEEFQKFAVAGTSTLEGFDDKAERLVTAMVDTSEELSKATSKLGLILEKINSGQGTAAKLLNDGRFYEDLLENTQQLDTLLKSLTSLIDQVKEKGLRSIY